MKICFKLKINQNEKKYLSNSLNYIPWDWCISKQSVYESGIGNEFIADAGGNIVVVLILCLFFWGFTAKGGTLKIGDSFNKVFDIFLITCFYILSEIAALFVSFLGVFDIKDVYGYLIGSILALLLIFILDKEEYNLLINKKFNK